MKKPWWVLLVWHAASAHRLRVYRDRFCMNAQMVQVHHIVPRVAFARDESAGVWLDVDASRNVMLLPAYKTGSLVTLRPVHDGGHDAYNRYVMERLRQCTCGSDARALQHELRQRLRRGDASLPWRA